MGAQCGEGMKKAQKIFLIPQIKVYSVLIQPSARRERNDSKGHRVQQPQFTVIEASHRIQGLSLVLVSIVKLSVSSSTLIHWQDAVDSSCFWQRIKGTICSAMLCGSQNHKEKIKERGYSLSILTVLLCSWTAFLTEWPSSTSGCSQDRSSTLPVEDGFMRFPPTPPISSATHSWSLSLSGLDAFSVVPIQPAPKSAVWGGELWHEDACF